jgi:hypothetical protein
LHHQFSYQIDTAGVGTVVVVVVDKLSQAVVATGVRMSYGGDGQERVVRLAVRLLVVAAATAPMCQHLLYRHEIVKNLKQK